MKTQLSAPRTQESDTRPLRPTVEATLVEPFDESSSRGRARLHLHAFDLIDPSLFDKVRSLAARGIAITPDARLCSAIVNHPLEDEPETQCFVCEIEFETRVALSRVVHNIHTELYPLD